MVGKVPRKFGERRRGGLKEMRPWAEGDYCAMDVMLSLGCVLWWSFGRPTAERETGRGKDCK